jgi:hypothetical protein
MEIVTTQNRTARALTEQLLTEQLLTEKDMTSQETISKHQEERNEARQDLRDTLSEVMRSSSAREMIFFPIILSRAIRLELPWSRVLWVSLLAQASRAG